MLAALLLASVIDFGAERPLDARPEYGVAPRGRERARVAVSDRGALVVWSDGRTGEWTVHGARLDRDGALLDPLGRVIAPAGIAGDVVWTGRAYLVAYSVHPIVYVRTMTPEGDLGAPIAIVDTEWVQAHTVRLATDGSTVLMMTNSGRGAVLTLDGEKRRELNFGARPWHEFSADIAVGNGAYGLAYIAPDGVAFRRIRADADEPEQILPDSNGARTVGLGSDGMHFLAVYDRKPGAVARLDAQRVGDAAPRILTNTGGAYPKLVWRGGDYLVTFSRPGSNDATAIRASAAGEPLGAPLPFGTATAPSHPDADRRPDGTGVAAWVSGHHRVEAGFFDSADAAPADVQPLSFSAPEQQSVRVDANGGAVVTMWLEVAPFRREVRLARGIGAPSIVVASGSVEPLDVLIEGGVVWAVWSQYPEGGLYARRYTTSLQPIDSEALRIFGSSPGVRVAVGGGALLLAASTGHIDPAVQVRLVREVNGMLSIESHLLPTTVMASRPVAAWNGREFVVAWADAETLEWYDGPGTERVAAQRIGLDGASVGERITLGGDDAGIHALEATALGDDVVLVWQTSHRATWIASVGSLERHSIENPLERKLAAITTVGEKVLMLWTAGDTEYVLLSRDVGEEERGALPVAATDLDLASAGTTPILGYARIAPEHGSVFRAFARTALPSKQRLVRR